MSFQGYQAPVTCHCRSEFQSLIHAAGMQLHARQRRADHRDELCFSIYSLVPGLADRLVL